jgi:hypothetical protein
VTVHSILRLVTDGSLGESYFLINLDHGKQPHAQLTVSAKSGQWGRAHRVTPKIPWVRDRWSDAYILSKTKGQKVTWKGKAFTFDPAGVKVRPDFIWLAWGWRQRKQLCQSSG